jgi:surface protein
MPNINPIIKKTDWQRPDDWLAMPTVVDTDQTFVGLHAVHEIGQNLCAFRFTTSSGQYEVDWGDGTTTLHDSATTAEHEYDYATYDTAGATLSTRGYKQAMIVVTPVSGDLTACNFQFRYITTPAQNRPYSTGFLDCILSMPNATSIIFGGTTVGHRYVERVNVLTIGAATSMVSMFNGCISLQSISLLGISNVTTMNNMFSGCISLQSVPLFDTSNVTTMTDMFRDCRSLLSVPLFNTSSVTNMLRMFRGCFALTTVPLFDTSNVTNTVDMFMECSSLQSVPLFDTSSVISMGNMFLLCSSLQSVPLFDTSGVTNMANMFQNCFSLKTLPNLDTSAGVFLGNFLFNASSFTGTDMIFGFSVNLNSCQLSREAIVNIFNNLTDLTSLTTQNITISNNWGASALTTGERDIALNKNWTITG